jgi:hypothetical protein
VAFSWYVYSKLSPREALKLEESLRAEVEKLLETQPGLVKKKGQWGDIVVEDAVPTPDDVEELSEAYGRDVEEEVLDRLEECRSAINVERAGVKDLDPLQVSILQFLLQRCGKCLVDWGDMQIVRSEEVIKDLGTFESAGILGDPSATPIAVTAPPAPERVSEPGLGRSTATERAIESLHEDPFLDRRFLRAIEKYPEFIKRYVKLLDERGALGDGAAAKELDVPLATLGPELQKLHDFAVDLAKKKDE